MLLKKMPIHDMILNEKESDWMGTDDLKVLEVVGQREYKNPMFGGRSITIDIYARDSDGKIYDIEVQRASSGADAHRARFHSSMIDTKMLKAMQEFQEIHDSLCDIYNSR